MSDERVEEEIVAAVRAIALARDVGICGATAFMTAATILLTCEGATLEQMTELVKAAHEKTLSTPILMEVARKQGA